MLNGIQIWSSNPFFIPADTEAQIDVDPVIFYYGADTKSTSSKVRKCVFDVSRVVAYCFKKPIFKLNTLK